MLVSETFANLERLAMALRHQALPSIYDDKGIQKNFMNSRGVINIDGEKYEDLSFSNVYKLLNKHDENLRVIVVDGVAGIGKTLLIRRIVHDRSQPESYKSGNPLLLHVESLGKMLTALNDRIAGTLANLRASFVEDELKPLIRRGLIQLAIDGFDELSDNRGYETAWGALRDFLRDLNGKGTCILAGRDTMLNERTVKEGLDTSIRDYPLIFMTLQEPNPDDIGNWLSCNKNWSSDREALEQIKNQAQYIEYIKRPFFVSLVSELGPDKFKESGGDPIIDLMNNMILRESEKIAPNSVEIGIDRMGELYANILAEVARIMMDDETDSIEVDLLALIIEETFTGELNKEAIEAIKNRAGTLAMLEQDKADPNSRVFPHEAIKSYFFSKSLVDYFPEYGPTNSLFRIPLNVEALNIFNRVVRTNDLQKQYILRDKLLETLSKSNIGYIKSNIGSLLLSFLPLENDQPGYGKDFVLAHLSMQDAWMREHTDVQRGKLSNCHISRLDVRGTDLSEVEFQDVTVNELLVDHFVKFGETAPDVKLSLIYSSLDTNASMKPEFDPNEIKDWISRRSHKKMTEITAGRIITDPRWKILEKFARISMRQYWLRTSDIEAIKLMKSDNWKDLVELLKRYDRLQETHRKHAAGPSSIWLHLVDGRDFLSFDEQGYSVRSSTREILRELGVPQ